MKCASAYVLYVFFFAAALLPGSAGLSRPSEAATAAAAAATASRHSSGADFLAVSGAEQDEPTSVSMSTTSTCKWLLGLVLMSCISFGGGLHSENGCKIGTGIATLVPFCVLLYILYSTDIFKRLYQGEKVDWWCSGLCVWCAAQIVVAAVIFACISHGHASASIEAARKTVLGANLDEKYAAAVAFESEWKPLKPVPYERKHLLYGLMKQVNEGDAKMRDQPYVWWVEDRAKWDAWKAHAGKSKEECMKEYVDEVEKQKAEFGEKQKAVVGEEQK